MIIDQHTGLYGIVGYPVGQSLSPAMHNAAFGAEGINAVYLAFETKDIRGCLKGLKALNIKGMSVTIPHKSDVIPLLDEVDSLAKQIGAVNTIVNQSGCLIGYNTDAPGALKALEEEVEVSGKTCLLVGAGGTAKAIGFMLSKKDVQLIITNRSVERGKALAGSLGCPYVPLQGLKGVHTDIIIQATSVGMYPNHDQCLISKNMVRKGTVVMDVVYKPVETRLIRMAKERGGYTINGLSMLIHQGAEQFRLWTGLEPPVDRMRKAVEKSLPESRIDES